MNYLLDTDAVVFLYDEQRQPQHQRMIHQLTKLTNLDLLHVSALTFYELEYSLANCSDTQKQRAIRDTIGFLKSDFSHILSITENGASIYGKLKAHLNQNSNLSRSSLQRHNIDLMLASTAIEHTCVLISGDQIHSQLQSCHTEFQWQCWWSLL